MCTLMKTLDMPSLNQKNGQNNKNKFITLFLKKNNEGENYRFRLLWFKNPAKNDRKTAYFSQYVHTHWGVSQNGTKIIDDVVVCPSTSYVHYDEEKFVLNEKTGKHTLNCPLCQKSTQNFAVYKNSGNTDKIASKNGYALRKTFRGIVPVYVVNDPNNNKNNGSLKVLIFTDEKEFEAFNNMVEIEKAKSYLAKKNGNPYEIVNGDRGVDFSIHVEEIQEVRNQGKPNEFTAKVRKITNMAFYPSEMAYPIPKLTKEFIGTLDMDDQYYVSNTKEELMDFYRKYYGEDEVVVPGENVDIFSMNKPTPQPKPVVENVNVVNTQPVTESSDIDSIDLDEVVTPTQQTQVVETENVEVENTKDTEEVDNMWKELGL